MDELSILLKGLDSVPLRSESTFHELSLILENVQCCDFCGQAVSRTYDGTPVAMKVIGVTCRVRGSEDTEIGQGEGHYLAFGGGRDSLRR